MIRIKQTNLWDKGAFNMPDIRNLLPFLKGRSVYIQTHNFPDPDAIASAYGLKQLLKNFDVDTTLCFEGKIDKLSATKMLDAFGIEMFAYSEICDKMKEEDAIICVDSQKNGGNITDFIGDEIAAIDHHPTFVKIAYQYSDIRITGACASIIAEYYKNLGISPDSNTATALLYGIRMDTLQFSRGVTQLDIDMFAYLFPFADSEKLTALERNNIELRDLQAYGVAIDNVKIYNRVGFSSVPFSCPDGLVAALSDFLLSLDEVDVAVIICHRENGIKLSVRSVVQEVQAGSLIREALAGIGDGGGHREMAGGMIKKEKLEEFGKYPGDFIREKFLQVLEKTSLT